MRQAILFLLIFLLNGSLAWGQDHLQKRVSFSFHSADLVDTLELLALEIGVETWFDPTVQGTVTLQVVKIPAQQALQQILDLQEKEFDFKLLAARSTKLTLVVAPPQELAKLKCPPLSERDLKDFWEFHCLQSLVKIVPPRQDGPESAEKIGVPRGY